MDRVHIPKLEIDDLGMGKLGWFMDDLAVPNEILYETDFPLFQSPCCNKRTAMQNHSIDADGTVNASILCLCGQYHVFGIFDDWPTGYTKPEGSLTVQRV
jgi:hypothetical protein